MYYDHSTENSNTAILLSILFPFYAPLTDDSLLLFPGAGRDGDLGYGVLEHLLTHLLPSYQLNGRDPV